MFCIAFIIMFSYFLPVFFFNLKAFNSIASIVLRNQISSIFRFDVCWYDKQDQIKFDPRPWNPIWTKLIQLSLIWSNWNQLDPNWTNLIQFEKMWQKSINDWTPNPNINRETFRTSSEIRGQNFAISGIVADSFLLLGNAKYYIDKQWKDWIKLSKLYLAFQ